MANTASGPNPFDKVKKTLKIKDEEFKFYSLPDLNDKRYEKLPYSIRVLLEAAVRNCDNFYVRESDVENILDWELNQSRSVEIPFKPSRVILQDFTGVPAVVDFAAMRDAVQRLGGDPEKINPVCPADLVIDHSIQVDVSRSNLVNYSPNPGGGQKSCQRSNLASPSKVTGQRAACNFCKDTTFALSDKVCPFHGQKTAGFVADILIYGTPLANRVDPDETAPTGAVSSGSTLFANSSNHVTMRIVADTLIYGTQEANIVDPDETAPTGAVSSGSTLFANSSNHVTMSADALEQNQMLEFERNKERFVFLKWGAKALENMLIVPPGSGIVHQVNLEYLARVVFSENGLLYPDSLVGTDSHTTMINGLGIVGWGVGGIEAEAVMLGQSISMVLPQVLGYKLTGKVNSLSTSTDVVLTITKHLRSVGVVGKFVEFFGPGVAELSIADRATISNMCPEYGATVGYFPVDEKSLAYLRQTGRDDDKITYIEQYLRANQMFRDFKNADQDPIFSEVIELDLSSVVPCCSGPKRPHDRVAVSDMKTDFVSCLSNKVGFKGFGIPDDKMTTTVPFVYEGKEYTLNHGSVVIAAVTSCTNTSNPSVMLGAGLLAKKAVEAGLTVSPYIKTSLSPGSGVVTYYLRESGVTPFLEKLGFDIVGYGCMTCIGNSGPLPEPVSEAIEKGDLVACGVLSGNRNFEGRIHPLTRANYLASPPLVIAYALAGRVNIDFETEPLGTNSEGNPVFLRDIWPSRAEIHAVEEEFVIPSMFNEVYSRIQKGNERWNKLEAPEGILYTWDDKSTYIKSPPFFETMTKDLPKVQGIKEAHVLLNFGDSVTTDHISPAGSIARNSPAARYLAGRGLTPREFNSYGSRRGNDAVMARGTFANIRLVNKFLKKPGPRTVYLPTDEEMDIYDAADRYRTEGKQVVILAGKEYGSGSSRDWAAKGPWILGVRAVIAESYERIHRSNLVGMGIVPFQYLEGQSASGLGLTGREQLTIDLPQNLQPGQNVEVKLSDGRSFQVKARFDTEVELVYFKNGGILNYMVRKILNSA